MGLLLKEKSEWSRGFWFWKKSIVPYY